MKKKVIIISSLAFVLIIILLVMIFKDKLALAFILKDIHPRDPRNEIEVTYNIGWWSNQESLKIDSLNIEILDSRLNLFNTYSLIRYSIHGELSKSGNWRPFIKNIHISERFIRNHNHELHPYLDHDTCNIPEAIIEITPVIDVSEDNKYNGEIIPFQITNEIKIQSAHWGNNWIRLKCGILQKDIILKQKK